MEAGTSPTDDVVIPLGLGCVEESGEVGQWNTKLTSVGELYPHKGLWIEGKLNLNCLFNFPHISIG